MTRTVRIPADVDRDDRLVAGLTARQLALLATAGLALAAIWAATRALVPLPVFLIAAAPFASVAVVLAIGRRDGLPADRLALAALRHHRSNRRLVPAPEGIPALPAGAPRAALPAPLDAPVDAVAPDGTLGLGDAGCALVCRASSLNFGLRTDTEQQAVVAAFGRWLNSLAEPVQILVRAERVDVSAAVADIERDASALPSVELEHAALDHARFLAALASRRDVLRRVVLVVFRSAQPDAGDVLARRADDAAAALGAAGISISVLAEPDARALLADAMNAGTVTRPAAATAAYPRDVEMRARRARQAPGPFGVALPESVEVEARRLRVGDTLHHTVAVTGYPRDVRLGWLEPLVTHPGPADVSLHIEPIAAPVAAERLRRQLGRLESSRRLDAAKGRLADPALDASAGDARDLADRLARGEGRLFTVGLYASCRGADPNDLEAESGRLRALLASLLLDTVPATYRSLPGWFTTLPVGLDLLRLRRTMDTAALAAAFPFASAELSDPAGVLWGRNTKTGGLVFWDRFVQPNYNTVILARSGAGKSYLAKLELLRSLYTGVEAAVIDPEDEYARLTQAVGGAYIHLGAPGVRFNPFDLDDQPDALTRRALFLHTLVAVLLGETPDPAARAALDTAIVAAYQQAGITADPRSHRRPPPTLADLADALDAAADPAGAGLAARLAPFVAGTHRHLFDGPTTTRPEGHLVTFSLREVPDELKAAGTLLVLDAVWRRVADPCRRRRRIVVVDEAWLVMRDPAGARFLHRLAKSARKHWCGLTVVTQDAADLLATDLGQAVVANAATQVLLRQAPQALDLLAGPFRLTDGETAYLAAAERGEGILLGGNERVGFAAEASPAEHGLITTDPADVEGGDDEDDA